MFMFRSPRVWTKVAAGLACSLAFNANPLLADSKSPTIAFLMPCSTCADRFEGQDKPLFIQTVRQLNPSAKVIANNAQGSGEAQINKAKAALSNGADVIVVSPLTEAAGAAIVDKAKAQHVPFVSYDGLITGAPTDFFVSFQNEKVGELQGRFLADHLPTGATIVVINGSQDIAPGRQFKTGAHQGVDSAIANGKLVLGYEAAIQSFDPSKAQAAMEQALTKLGDKVNGVLVANDGMAGAIVVALTARPLNGKVLVTGQDATDAGLQRILAGDQTMTVYKAIKREAEAAAKVGIALSQGRDVKALATTTVNNGAGEVPAILLDPVIVTRDNLSETVISDGFTTRERIGLSSSGTPGK
jgi:D-xylose transport system substrate-binding protein